MVRAISSCDGAVPFWQFQRREGSTSSFGTIDRLGANPGRRRFLCVGWPLGRRFSLWTKYQYHRRCSKCLLYIRYSACDPLSLRLRTLLCVCVFVCVGRGVMRVEQLKQFPGASAEGLSCTQRRPAVKSIAASRFDWIISLG
jgi:hypothetical protein